MGCGRESRGEECGGGEAHGARQSSPCTVPRMGDSEHEESPKERTNRELLELLNELRVALPGVQVLFAFLLAVPFARGWQRVTTFQRDVFFVAFIATTLSSISLIAPSAFHRIGWRVADKGRLVRTGNTLTLVGLGFLAVAIECVVLLVTDYIFERTTAIVVTALLALVFAGVWVVWPLRVRDER